MNTTVLTAATDTLCSGSTETFQLRAVKDGQLWDLTGGTVKLGIIDPVGELTLLSASSAYNGGAKVNWTVAFVSDPNDDNPTNFLRYWDVTDAGGVRQVSLPIAFKVRNSTAL